MQCPECGHNVANGRTECLYCGAVLGGTAFAKDLESFEKHQMRKFSRQVGKDGSLYEVTEERKEYNSIDDVPGDWQKKIVEAVRQGGGDVTPDPSIDIFSIFSHTKTPRRERLHPLILALIFFASAGVVGIVLWLLT